MKMLLPGKKLRRMVLAYLTAFYNDKQYTDFDAAMDLLCSAYDHTLPLVEWCEYIGHGKTLGQASSDGTWLLVHPENWRKMPATPAFKPTCARWVRTVLHEFHHHLTIVDAEKKADLYAVKFVTGL